MADVIHLFFDKLAPRLQQEIRDQITSRRDAAGELARSQHAEPKGKTNPKKRPCMRAWTLELRGYASVRECV